MKGSLRAKAIDQREMKNNSFVFMYECMYVEKVREKEENNEQEREKTATERER
jgi:hypothetical protein